MEKLELSLLRKRAWLLVIIMLIGGAGAFFFTRNRPVTYEAQARLMVGPGIDSPNPDLNVLRAGGQLIQMYSELPLTEPFLENVIKDLRLDISPARLASLISMRPNQETQILTVQVRHTNAEEAKAIASAVALRLVQISPSNPDSTAAVIKGHVHAQAIELEQSVSNIKQNIQQLELDYRNAVANEIQGREEAGSNKYVVEQLREFEEYKTSIGDAAQQQVVGIRILQELVINSNARLLQFEQELEGETNTITQKLIRDQIRLERNHLSQLQLAIAEIEHPVDGMTLDQYITTTQARIEQLEQGVTTLLNVDLRRIQFDQINRERDKLSQARAIESNRQKRILEQISQERDRVSQIELAGIEKKRLILEEIAKERDLLSETQNTLAMLYNSIREADPNQVKIIEMPSQANPIAAPISLAVLIGALAGLALGVFGVVALEMLNGNVQTAAQVLKLGSGLVVDIQENTSGVHDLFATSPLQEEYRKKYRTLSLHILFGQNGKDNRLLVVGAANGSTSAGTSAVSLAISLSQSGKRVLLVETDRENPVISSFFRLHKQEGFSDYVSGKSINRPAMASIEEYPSLSVLPYGNAYIEPSWLASPKALSQIEQLHEYADIVVYSLPDLNQPEAMMLASRASGVILVIQKGKITQTSLSEIISNLQLIGAKVLATIFEPKHAPALQQAWIEEIEEHNTLRRQGNARQDKSKVTSDPEGGETLRSTYTS